MFNPLSRLTLLIKLFSWWKIPLLAYVRPSVVELSDSVAVVRLKLGRRSKNHANSMYFGALAMGAELSIAVSAVSEMASNKKFTNLLFKRFECEFLRRADGDTYFVCTQPSEVKALLEQCRRTHERVEGIFQGFAYVDQKTKEPVMKYQLTLSFKS